MIEFFIPLKTIPSITSQQKGINFEAKRVYTKYEARAARALFAANLAPYVPPQPFAGGVELQVGWCYPLGGGHKNGEWKTTKPDTDNLIKILKDCMTVLHFWQDDAQVVYETSWKRYADISGIYIRVAGIGEVWH